MNEWHGFGDSHSAPVAGSGVLFGSYRVLEYARTVQNKFLETGVDDAVNIKVNLVTLFARCRSPPLPLTRFPFAEQIERRSSWPGSLPGKKNSRSDRSFRENSLTLRNLLWCRW
jgi:hypothetical protein